MELYIDEHGDYKGRIVNCVNLLDVGKKRKSPMQTPDQIKYLKELILAYNGNAPDYENIEAILALLSRLPIIIMIRTGMSYRRN